ncbi:BLUF domain-containing protein [Henriciella mobilis]|uniref:BLUF domain-containing protein n=1 Tax=Henriciella mobilis TaxID=2305467 RepID=UPI000E667F63|nr:BLUF domain-containing protein [Henriciella mobilis]RIJ13906.1 BLUF domain-containing protein [Henriciella mobilis]RIJ20885.1 BLUF domain-containing protein [Henriciella mobilis]
MYRLAYVSTSHTHLSAEDMQDVLESAIRNNKKAGVSGTLLFNGMNFLQILEGPEEEVERIYTRICEDSRHNHVVTIFRESGARRCFEKSPMTLNTVSSKVGALPDGLTLSSDIDLFIPASLPSHLRGMIYSFSTMRG